MKLVLIYTGPNKKFDHEHSILAKIQIDNSLDLGWKKEDILLATDFPFEYNGVRSLDVPNDIYYEFDKNANKSAVIIYLLTEGIIKQQEIYWCHDFDAYELNKIDEAELGLSDFDMGLVHYLYKPEWSFSNIFFKESAKDILELLDNTIRVRPWKSRNNEKTLTWLIRKGKIGINRYKKMDVTYNITKRCLETVYNQAQKPIKVLHFHPWDKDAMMNDTALNIFMYGKNRIKKPLMNERLIDIFHHHGVR